MQNLLRSPLALPVRATLSLSACQLGYVLCVLRSAAAFCLCLSACPWNCRRGLEMSCRQGHWPCVSANLLWHHQELRRAGPGRTHVAGDAVPLSGAARTLQRAVWDCGTTDVTRWSHLVGRVLRGIRVWWHVGARGMQLCIHPWRAWPHWEPARTWFCSQSGTPVWLCFPR